MKINRALNQQTLRELSKSIADIAKLLGEEAAGIECKRVEVGKSTDANGVYNVDIHIRLSLIDEVMDEVGEIFERFK